jgi:hypothetical protein
MTNFPGYTTVVTDKSNVVLSFFDLSPEACVRYGFEEWEVPYCPLAAVGKTLRLMSREMMYAFSNNEIFITVIKGTIGGYAKAEKDVYDIDKMNYELDLEFMAG